MISGSKLNLDIGRTRLYFVELECCHVAPDAERSEQSVTNLVVAQIGREVENPAYGRTNEIMHAVFSFLQPRSHQQQ